MVKGSFIKTAVALMLTAMLFGALALSVSAVTADVNDVTARRGETVSFTVTLSESITVGSAAVDVIFDEKALEYAKGNGSGEWNVPEAMLSAFYSNSGKGVVAFLTSESLSGDVFTVTFKVRDDAPIGSSEVRLDVILKDGNGETIELEKKSGTLTVVGEGGAEPAGDLHIVIPVICGAVLVAVIIVIFIVKKNKK